VGDVFKSAKPTRKEFDRWGRYLLPHPVTGKTQAWTRSTTFARTISDTYGLGLWQQRMVLKGAALRPGLTGKAHDLDVSRDKQELGRLVEDAKAAAGANEAADLGTVIHKHAERVDGGEIRLDQVPETFRRDVAAYQDALRVANISVILSERRTCWPRYGVAGKFDSVGEIPRPVTLLRRVVDIKTGRDLSYSWAEIACQLAVYANGLATSGYWDPEAEAWVPVEGVDTTEAIVAHVPAGSGSCELYTVDLTKALRGLELCRDVRDWRKEKGFAKPYEGPENHPPFFLPDRAPADVGLAEWEERFMAITSRAEGSALYREAVREMGAGEAARLAGIGLRALDKQSGL
jgi:hypothetical protein